MHLCQTFLCAPRLPPLPLATFIRTACRPSTSPTYVRMCCRTSLVHTAVRHFYILRVCRYYGWLHSYVLLVCHQHRRTPFVRIAEPRCYAIPSYPSTFSESAAMTAGYIRTLHLPAVIIANLGSDALQNVVGMHRCPTFVRTARLLSTSPTSVRMRCSSANNIADLGSYALQPHWYAPQSDIFISSASAAITAGYIRTHCSSAVNIAELRSYALQNLVCICRCPTFVRAAPPPSTSLTYVSMHCRTSLEFTTVLHSYVLLVCCQHR